MVSSRKEFIGFRSGERLIIQLITSSIQYQKKWNRKTNYNSRAKTWKQVHTRNLEKVEAIKFGVSKKLVNIDTGHDSEMTLTSTILLVTGVVMV